MDELLDLLQRMDIEILSPPEWEDIRQRCIELDESPIDRLGILAIGNCWELLTNHRFHHSLYIRLLCASCGVGAGKETFDKFTTAFFSFISDHFACESGHLRIAIQAFCRNCWWNIDGDGAVVRAPNPDHKYRVLLGLEGVFLRGGIDTKGNAEYSRLVLWDNLRRLQRNPGIQFELQTELFICWLAAMDYEQPGTGEVVCTAVEEFLEFHDRDSHDELFSPQRSQPHWTQASAHDLCVVKCLAFWLRAAPDSSRTFDATVVTRLSQVVLDFLRILRVDAKHQLAEFNWSIGWGYFAWAVSALVAVSRPGLERRNANGLLAENLERFSGQMAVYGRSQSTVTSIHPNTVPANDSGPNATPLGIRSPVKFFRDPSPTVMADGLRWSVGMPWDGLLGPRARRQGSAISATEGSSESHESNVIPPDVYRVVTQIPEITAWDQVIPKDAAFMGAYELPFSHRPVVVLAVRIGDEIIVETESDPTWQVRSAARGMSASATELKHVGIGENLVVSKLHSSAIRYQRANANYWEQHARKAGNGRRIDVSRLSRSLASSVFRFHEEHINPIYGPLIDLVVEHGNNALRRRGEALLQDRDLIFCPRGPIAAGIPFLLGQSHKLGANCRSITTTPSLGLFSYLHRRAEATSVPKTPRLNIASWFQSDSAEASVAERLIERSAKELTDSTELWFAGDSPMTTVSRTAAMADVGDWTMLLAHGRNGPTAVRLADGAFPIDLPPCKLDGGSQSDGGSVVFLLSCVAGRMTQTAPFVDSFGPLTDEVLLSFCLSDRLRRKPTLAGSFTQPILADAAVDLGVDLVKRRLSFDAQYTHWSAFARVYHELISQQIADTPFAKLMSQPQLQKDEAMDLLNWAAENDDGWSFLRLHAGLNFRLIGCEPTWNVNTADGL